MSGFVTREGRDSCFVPIVSGCYEGKCCLSVGFRSVICSSEHVVATKPIP